MSRPNLRPLLLAALVLTAACSSTGGTTPPGASTSAPASASAPASVGPTAASSPTVDPTGVAGDWVVVTPEGAGFTVHMPGEPEFITQSVSTAIGNVDLRLGTWEATDGAYALAWGIYPDAVLQADPADILEGARDGSISNTNGTLVEDEAVTFQGIPGRRFRATVPGGTSETVVLLDGQKFIQLAVVYADGATGYDADRYFASFAKG